MRRPADDRDLRLPAEEIPRADPKREALAARPGDDDEANRPDDQEERDRAVHGTASGGRRAEGFQDHAVPHDDDALHLIADRTVVRDDDEREPFLRMEALHQ